MTAPAQVDRQSRLVTGLPVRAVRVLAAVVAALVAVVALALTGAVATGQLAVARVTTGSMAPAVPQGSLVAGRPVRPAGLRVGDLLTAHVPDVGGSVTHRVVAVTVDGGRTLVRTRGDANSDDDPWTTVLPAPGATRVVAAVPHLGGLTARGPLGVPLLALPLLVLAAAWSGCARLLRLLREQG